MANNIGPKIAIDGEAEFRRQIQRINDQAKELASEMKAVTASFTKNTTAQERAAATSAALTKQIQTQKDRIAALNNYYSEGQKKLSELEKAMQDAVKARGEDSKEAIRAAKAYDDEAAALSKYKVQINNATAELNKMENELAESTDTSNNWAKSLAKVAEYSDDLERELKEGANATTDLGNEMKKAEASTDGFAKELGEVLVGAAKAAASAVAAAGVALGAIVKNSIEDFSEYEQLVGGVKKIFQDGATEILEAANTAYKSSGLSANDYMETATSFSSSLVQSLSGDTQRAAQLTDVAIRDMSDNMNTFGTDIKMLQNAYQGFAKDQYTMLDNLKLGYGGTQKEMQRLLDHAEEISGIHYELGNMADMIEAIHVVQEGLQITGTTAAEAEKTIAGSANAMKAAWENWTVGMADADQDAKTLTDALSETILTFANNIAPRIKQALPAVVGGLSGIAAALIPEIGPMLQDLLPAFVEGATGLVNSVISLLPGLIQTAIGSLPTLVEAAISIVQSLTVGFSQAFPLLKDAAGELLENLILFFGRKSSTADFQRFGSAFKLFVWITRKCRTVGRFCTGFDTNSRRWDYCLSAGTYRNPSFNCIQYCEYDQRQRAKAACHGGGADLAACDRPDRQHPGYPRKHAADHCRDLGYHYGDQLGQLGLEADRRHRERDQGHDGRAEGNRKKPDAAPD